MKLIADIVGQQNSPAHQEQKKSGEIKPDKKAKPKRTALAQINAVLVVLILLINLFIVAKPFAPRLSLWLHKRETKKVAGAPYKTQLDKSSAADSARKPVPNDERLVIPKIALDQHIYQGTSPYLVNKGVWADSQASTPPNGSNTVLIGHRFTYNGPATFYSLDKVTTNIAVIIYWQGKEYDYRVVTIRVVPPTAVEITQPTQNAQLTIYTCTPLWTAKNRLVVIAEPVGASHE